MLTFFFFFFSDKMELCVAAVFLSYFAPALGKCFYFCSLFALVFILFFYGLFTDTFSTLL